MIGAQQILKPTGVELQSAAAEDAICTAVQEKTGLDDVTDDGDAVFHVAVTLQVSPGKSRNIDERGNGEGAYATGTSRTMVGQCRIRSLGNERDRSNRANVG